MIHPSCVGKETCSCAEVSPASINTAIVPHAYFIVACVYSLPPRHARQKRAAQSGRTSGEHLAVAPLQQKVSHTVPYPLDNPCFLLPACQRGASKEPDGRFTTGDLVI